MLYKGAPPFSMSALYIIMNFNPRAPYGARPNIRGVWMWWHSFNPRAPCRARPANLTIGYLATTVSIHAPHAGRDHASPQHSSWTCSFNPRAPCGARQCRHRLRPWQHPVSIHAPRVGRDGWRSLTRGSSTVSIHAPRVGRDMFCYFRLDSI